METYLFTAPVKDKKSARSVFEFPICLVIALAMFAFLAGCGGGGEDADGGMDGAQDGETEDGDHAAEDGNHDDGDQVTEDGSHDDGDQVTEDGNHDDGDNGDPDHPEDSGPPPDCAPLDDTDSPQPSTRGLSWVRQNKLYLTGYNVSMGIPAPDVAREYFDDFGATAAHFAATGLPHEVEGWREATGDGYRFASGLNADGTSMINNEIIGGAPPGQPGRIGYYISDEPGMPNAPPWSEFRQGIQAVRAADPEGLIIVNFNTIPDESEVESYIEEFTTSLDGDVISCDIYARSDLWDEYPWIALFRRKGLEANRPYWAYLNAFSDTVDMDFWSESDMRFEAFLYLLHGYSGFSWFVYQVFDGTSIFPAFFEAANDFYAPKTPRYYFASQINTELLNLGRSTTQLTSTDVRYLTTTPMIDLWLYAVTTAWDVGAGDNTHISAITPEPNANIALGFFDDDYGEKYVMVVNLHHSGCDFYCTSLTPFSVRFDFDFSNASDPCFDKGAILELNRHSGDVETIVLNNPGNHPYVEIVLDAGEPFFFKYKTRRSFAMADW
jgi:hypothetical protein